MTTMTTEEEGPLENFCPGPSFHPVESGSRAPRQGRPHQTLAS